MEILEKPLIWIDLETTGLHVDKDCILEIACIITDGNLHKRYEGPSFVIHRSKEILEHMDDWCIHQHEQTGLTKASLNSSVTIKQAEIEILEFIKKYAPEKKVCNLAGSSVHFDKEFLRKEMPELFDHLHYRIVDVTTIGEVVRRWFPMMLRQRPRKHGNHRALDDIRNSIREMEFYKNSVFIQASPQSL